MQRWQRFEDEIRQLTEHFGYSSYRTPGSGDHGVDVICEKQGRKVVVQVKLHTSSRVGNGDILKLLGGKSVHHASEALFITTGDLTRKAKEACEQAKVVYYDRSRLRERLVLDGICLPSWCMLVNTRTLQTCLIPESLSVGRDVTCDLVHSVDFELPVDIFNSGGLGSG